MSQPPAALDDRPSEGAQAAGHGAQAAGHGAQAARGATQAVPRPLGSGGARGPATTGAPGGAVAPGVWQLAWPTIVGNLLQSTVGLVDMMIVGTLGAAALAAVTTGNRLFFVLQAVLMAITAGTTALVARAWGAGDPADAASTTRASIGLCTAFGLLTGLLGFAFADPLAAVFRLEGDAVALGASFIRWLSVFNAGFAIMMGMGAALRAAGDVVTPLWIGAVTNVVNVALVYSLVHGRFGLPAMGVRGAAIASGLAFTLGAAISLALWLAGGLRVGVGSGPTFGRDRIRRLVRVGTPAGLEQFALQLGFVGFLFVVSFYGTAPYAAYGIGVQILAFSFVVGFGFSIAASTLVGQHLGADDPDGAERSGWRAMWLSIGAMIVLGVAIVTASEAIARLMIDDPEVVRLTVLFIWILGACQPLMAIEFTLSGALRGAGDTRFPLVTVLVGFFVVRIPLAALAAWLGLDVAWVYGALIADYSVKGTLLATRFRRGRWKTVVV